MFNNLNNEGLECATCHNEIEVIMGRCFEPIATIKTSIGHMVPEKVI